MDYAKVFRIVNNGCDKQQNDISQLVIWSEKWLMLLNFVKCKRLHTGLGNLHETMNVVDTTAKRTYE